MWFEVLKYFETQLLSIIREHFNCYPPNPQIWGKILKVNVLAGIVQAKAKTVIDCAKN